MSVAALPAPVAAACPLVRRCSSYPEAGALAADRTLLVDQAEKLLGRPRPPTSRRAGSGRASCGGAAGAGEPDAAPTSSGKLDAARAYSYSSEEYF